MTELMRWPKAPTLGPQARPDSFLAYSLVVFLQIVQCVVQPICLFVLHFYINRKKLYLLVSYFLFSQRFLKFFFFFKSVKIHAYNIKWTNWLKNKNNGSGQLLFSAALRVGAAGGSLGTWSRAGKESVKAAGSIATKHWPRFAT